MAEAVAAAGLAWYATTDPTSATPIFMMVLVFGTARAFAAPAVRSMPADLVPYAEPAVAHRALLGYLAGVGDRRPGPRWLPLRDRPVGAVLRRHRALPDRRSRDHHRALRPSRASRAHAITAVAEPLDAMEPGELEAFEDEGSAGGVVGEPTPRGARGLPLHPARAGAARRDHPRPRRRAVRRRDRAAPRDRGRAPRGGCGRARLVTRLDRHRGRADDDLPRRPAAASPHRRGAARRGRGVRRGHDRARRDHELRGGVRRARRSPPPPTRSACTSAPRWCPCSPPTRCGAGCWPWRWCSSAGPTSSGRSSRA